MVASTPPAANRPSSGVPSCASLISCVSCGLGTDVGSVEAIEGTIQSDGPGCYHIDEIAAEPLTVGPHLAPPGDRYKRPDGQCTLDPDPWPGR